jgi:hypothetical protein
LVIFSTEPAFHCVIIINTVFIFIRISNWETNLIILWINIISQKIYDPFHALILKECTCGYRLALFKYNS